MTSNMPHVSIVTPSFNQSRYVEQTMRSVLEQDHPRIEYLVIDGASKDESVDIIKKYERKLAYWVSEKDSGQAEAINKGLARAKGEIVAWLNSDDYHLPGAVSAAVKVFESHPDVALIYGDMLAVDENGRTTNIMKYGQLSLADLVCFQIIGQPSVFFRRDALNKAGLLDTTFHFLLDHQLWIRIAMQGNILHVPQTWSAARYHAEAKNVAKAAQFGHEAFRILDWAKGQPGLAGTISGVERRARASAHRVDARYLLDGCQSWSALKAWMRALFIHPPTALKRLNIFVSALLNASGLSALRGAILRRRKRSFSGDK